MPAACTTELLNCSSRHLIPDCEASPRNRFEATISARALSVDDLATIKLNGAFAAQGLALLRQLGIADDDPRVNPNGGAIALGHPLGMSGARLVLTVTEELTRNEGRYGLATMCVGVGQGISLLLERV